MSDQNVTFRLQAIDDASAVFRDVGKTADDTLNKMSRGTETNIAYYKEMNTRIRESNMVWRVQTYEVKQYLSVLNQVGNIGQTVMNIWQAYTVGQIRVERATRDVADAHRDVVKWQNLMNEALQTWGEDSADYLYAKEQWLNVLSREKDATDAATKATSDMNLGYFTMGMTAFTAAAHIGTLFESIQKLGGVTGIITTLAGGFTTIASVLGGFGGILALPAIAYIQGGPKAVLPEPVYLGVGPKLPEEWWQWIPFAEDIAKLLGSKQFGGFIPQTGPYLLHAGEEVLPKERVRETKPGLINVGITQYNTISRDVDFEMAGEAMYRSFTRKLANKW
jgi:hypothetical protein